MWDKHLEISSERKRGGTGCQKGPTGWERQRLWEGISGAMLGLRLVSAADGYLSQPSELWGRLLDRKWMGCQIKGCGKTGTQGHRCREDQKPLLVCHCNAVWFNSGVSADKSSREERVLTTVCANLRDFCDVSWQLVCKGPCLFWKCFEVWRRDS